jgi:hypothetical protein
MEYLYKKLSFENKNFYMVKNNLAYSNLSSPRENNIGGVQVLAMEVNTSDVLEVQSVINFTNKLKSSFSFDFLAPKKYKPKLQLGKSSYKNCTN